MKFYYSPFVMPVGIIAFTVVSMLTNDVNAPGESATDQAHVIVPAELSAPGWYDSLNEADEVTNPTTTYPYAKEVDFIVTDTVTIAALPSI